MDAASTVHANDEAGVDLMQIVSFGPAVREAASQLPGMEQKDAAVEPEVVLGGAALTLETSQRPEEVRLPRPLLVFFSSFCPVGYA